MNVLVLGHKQHGKTTVARMLRHYGLSFVDTSDLLIDLAIKLNIEEHKPEKVHHPSRAGVPQQRAVPRLAGALTRRVQRAE